MKTIFRFLFSLMAAFLVAAFSGTGISMATGLHHGVVIGAICSISAISTFTPSVISATVFKEVWTGEVIKKLSTLEKATFLDGISDYSRYVSNVGDEAQAIHLIYMGVLPDVLINNSTYPIPLQTLDEEDVVISLDKYQTKATPITDDELFALSYKKISHVKDHHALAISRSKFQKSIHALAPASDTTEMPVLLTTGDDDGTGRKRLTWDDIITLKSKLDALEVPAMGRRLVLCNDHVNDLLLTYQSFKDQYYNRADGTIANQLGFELFEYAGNPFFRPSTKVKLAFGATPLATDRRASVFFSLERSAKAEGWTKMYYSEASLDTEYQQNKVNFRHYYIVLPTMEEARGAIVSDNVPVTP